MSRRVHTNLNGDYDNKYNFENSQQNYNYYSDAQEYQENYNYEANFDYTGAQNTINQNENNYSANNANAAYDHQTNYNSFNDGINQNSLARHTPIVQASFPVVQPPPLVQQSPALNYTSQYNYGPNSEKSWISAFGSGGFDNEPPLLEELGINFSHIKDKTLASLNPFRKLDAGTLNDADLTGPLLFCFLFGTSLLLSGKVHFGYIYGVATLGWISIFTILNLMTESGVSFYLTASILGYCLLPMVLLSAVAVLLRLRGVIGLILGVTSVSWCTFSSSTYFVTAFAMQNQQILIAYPIFLLYSCFALMTIF